MEISPLNEQEGVQVPALEFSNLLKFFPVVKLPLMLTGETYKLFIEKRAALPDDFVNEFLLTPDDEPLDDFSQVMPVAQFSLSKGYLGLIYWREGLSGYLYHLLTFVQTGTRLHKVTLCGTYYTDAGQIVQSVAAIRPDLSVFVKDGMDSSRDILNEDKGMLKQLRLSELGEISEE